MWVIKLGGSLADSDELMDWLQVISTHGQGQVVVVPGGGEFAETVRRMQKHWRFSDQAAHQMALWAMVQYSLMLSDLMPLLHPVATADEIHNWMHKRRIPVWQPLALQDAGIEASWRVTSDSLALWLARQLNSPHLVLIKSCTVPAISITELINQDIIDNAFGDFYASYHGETFCLGPGQQTQLAQALTNMGRLKPIQNT